MSAMRGRSQHGVRSEAVGAGPHRSRSQIRAGASAGDASTAASTEVPRPVGAREDGGEVAVIIACPDKISYLVRRLNSYLTFFLKRLPLKRFKIFLVVAESADDSIGKDEDRPFNRGQLMNFGFELALREGFTTCIFQDPHLMPMPSLAQYYAEFPVCPVHIGAAERAATRMSAYYCTFEDVSQAPAPEAPCANIPEELATTHRLDGVVAMSALDFRRCNGFPNDVWQAGGEEWAVLRARMACCGLRVKRASGTLCDVSASAARKFGYIPPPRVSPPARSSRAPLYGWFDYHLATWKYNGLNELVNEIESCVASKETVGPNCVVYTVRFPLNRDACHRPVPGRPQVASTGTMTRAMRTSHAGVQCALMRPTPQAAPQPQSERRRTTSLNREAAGSRGTSVGASRCGPCTLQPVRRTTSAPCGARWLHHKGLSSRVFSRADSRRHLIPWHYVYFQRRSSSMITLLSQHINFELCPCSINHRKAATACTPILQARLASTALTRLFCVVCGSWSWTTLFALCCTAEHRRFEQQRCPPVCQNRSRGTLQGPTRRAFVESGGQHHQASPRIWVELAWAVRTCSRPGGQHMVHAAAMCVCAAHTPRAIQTAE